MANDRQSGIQFHVSALNSKKKQCVKINEKEYGEFISENCLFAYEKCQQIVNLCITLHSVSAVP